MCRGGDASESRFSEEMFLSFLIRFSSNVINYERFLKIMWTPAVFNCLFREEKCIAQYSEKINLKSFHST